MGKQYKSVSEMLKNISGDQAFTKGFEQDVAEKTLSKTLFAMRCSRGMRQKEMASRLACTQSRISKLENSRVDGIRVSDLVDYAKVLKLNLAISFHDRMTPVECVKFHALEIKKHLDYLAELAGGDDVMSQGVEAFHAECMAVIAKIIKESMSRLKKMRPRQVPLLEVNAPDDSPISADLLAAID